jgi:hypothetical protein
LEFERPALRSSSCSVPASSAGVGVRSPNRPWSLAQIDAAAFVESCWPTIARASAS